MRTPRGERAPAPFVLPGESLSKYGANPVSDAHKSESFETPKPAQPVSTFKPASLIQSPIEWDGSGLLPGESISKHRSRQQEPEVENPAALLHTTLDSEAVSADAIEEEQLVEDLTVPVETTPLEPGIAQSLGDSAAIPEEDDVLEETFELASGSPEPSEAISSKHSDELVETATVEGEDSSNPAHVGPSNSETAEDDSTEDDGNRTASHNVDPFSPVGFRLFGLGGKKKKSEDEPPPIQPVPPAEPKAASVPSVSAFAPGSGLVEEEVIEGDEYELPHHHHKTDEHDLDEYEEETLQTQIRSGELGEMLQEAHLDHRIQLNFDSKNGDEEAEDAFDGEEDEEEEPVSADGQPAGEGQAQPRRDRNARGRRGRGAPGGQGIPSPAAEAPVAATAVAAGPTAPAPLDAPAPAPAAEMPTSAAPTPAVDLTPAAAPVPPARCAVRCPACVATAHPKPRSSRSRHPLPRPPRSPSRRSQRRSRNLLPPRRSRRSHARSHSHGQPPRPARSRVRPCVRRHVRRLAASAATGTRPGGSTALRRRRRLPCQLPRARSKHRPPLPAPTRITHRPRPTATGSASDTRSPADARRRFLGVGGLGRDVAPRRPGVARTRIGTAV